MRAMQAAVSPLIDHRLAMLEVQVFQMARSSRPINVLAATNRQLYYSTQALYGAGYIMDSARRVILNTEESLDPKQGPFTWHPEAGTRSVHIFGAGIGSSPHAVAGVQHASQHMACIETIDADGNKHFAAAVVCSPRHIMTYQHNQHSHMTIGTEVQARFPVMNQDVRAVVVDVDAKLDCVILQLQDQIRLPTPDIRPAVLLEPYVILAPSIQEQPHIVEPVGKGQIITLRVNRRGHILGNTAKGRGYPGGVFSLGGSLLGMSIGQQLKPGSSYIIPANGILNKVSRLQLSPEDLYSLGLGSESGYDSD